MSKKAVILLYPNSNNKTYLERIQKNCAEKGLSLFKVLEAENSSDLKVLTELYNSAQESVNVSSLIIDDLILDMPVFPLAWIVFGIISWTKPVAIDFLERDENKPAKSKAALMDRAMLILNHHLKNLNDKGDDRETNYHCSLEVINTGDETMLFYHVEKLLKSLILPADACRELIKHIKNMMLLEQKPNTEDYINYLAETEKASNDFPMNKIFSFLPTYDKYVMINSIFSRLQVRNDHIDYSLKKSFRPVLRR